MYNSGQCNNIYTYKFVKYKMKYMTLIVFLFNIQDTIIYKNNEIHRFPFFYHHSFALHSLRFSTIYLTWRIFPLYSTRTYVHDRVGRENRRNLVFRHFVLRFPTFEALRVQWRSSLPRFLTKRKEMKIRLSTGSASVQLQSSILYIFNIATYIYYQNFQGYLNLRRGYLNKIFITYLLFTFIWTRLPYIPLVSPNNLNLNRNIHSLIEKVKETKSVLN